MLVTRFFQIIPQVEAKKAVPRDDQQVITKSSASAHSSPGPGRTKKIFVGGLASTTDYSNISNIDSNGFCY